MQLWLLNDTNLVCSSVPNKVSSIWKPIFPQKHQKAIASVENLSFKERRCSGLKRAVIYCQEIQLNGRLAVFLHGKEIRLCPLGPQ